ncbi:ABC transporter permease [Roseivirga sp.]|uniref:ABC transporter permease n=1 Tax=Roseivirga sp. TaxID=1964215 RepID=UPI003B8BD1FA
MKKHSTHPPRWARKFLEWYCRADILEDLQGDLHEYFDRNIEEKGVRKARLNYIIDVFKFFKPYTVKKLVILDQLTQYVMFKNYFKTSVRSIVRNKLFSAINIVGLAISMSICLLVISIISETFSYDRFHKDYDRIHRVVTKHQFLEQDPSDFASTSILVGQRTQKEIPGIESSVIIASNYGKDFQLGDRVYPVSGRYADKSFFEVFSFNLLRGNAETALSEPHSIVITDETATRLYAGQDPLGEIITTREGENYTITGIVAKPPHESHMTFQSLISLSTFINEQKEIPDNDYWIAWSNIWSNYVYVKLDENTDPAQVDQKLQIISNEENEGASRVKITTRLQPMTNIVLESEMSNNIGKTIGIQVIYIFGGLTLVVILSAGFNYTNLSIARSLRRSKEVGVRKVVGATRGHIFTQFIVEATIISIVALIISFFLMQLIKPQFQNLLPELADAFRLETKPVLFLYFFFFAVLVGVIAGTFPALFLSKLNAINALKNSGSTRLFSKVNMRKALIVVQFTLSITFIVAATIGNKQYKYALGFDLGFNTENVLNIRVQNNDLEMLENAFSTIPEVTEIAKSTLVVSTGSTYGSTMKFEDPMDSITLYYNGIDENYIPLMKHELIAGVNFSGKAKESDQETEIILNESALERFSIGTPLEAIDKYVQVNENKLRIIGVVRDFHYRKIQEEIEPFGFRHNSEQYYIMNLKVNTTDLPAAIDKIEAAWTEVDDVHDFEAQFYEERIERAYADFSILFTVVSFLALLTISIAAMGLLGMSVYTAETRLKEISIRKVLGATEGSLVKLLAKSFMWLLCIAAFIGVPVTYFVFDSLILIDMANRVDIGVVELFSGVLVIFIIGFFTIGSQTWKAAKSNPAQTLRTQ